MQHRGKLKQLLISISQLQYYVSLKKYNSLRKHQEVKRELCAVQEKYENEKRTKNHILRRWVMVCCLYPKVMHAYVHALFRVF